MKTIVEMTYKNLTVQIQKDEFPQHGCKFVVVFKMKYARGDWRKVDAFPDWEPALKCANERIYQEMSEEFEV